MVTVARLQSPLHPPYWIRAVAETFFVGEDELLGQYGTKEVQQYRLVAMWIAREMTGMSYPALAKAFHKDDHTTIWNGIKRVEEDKRLAELVEEVFEYVEARDAAL